MAKRLAIFDVDGTLVDSRQVISRAMATAFEAMGLDDPGYERTRVIVGLSLDEACRRLAPRDYADDDLAQLVEAYKNAFIAQRSQPEFDEPLYDGAIEILERLAERDGWSVGVATGKARRGIASLFARHPIERFIHTVHCADDGPGKPHPFMVEEAMRAMDADAASTVVIGDTSYDMEMARAAGARALGVTWGFHERAEIAAGGAHEIHDNFAGLNAAVDAFARSLEEAAP